MPKTETAVDAVGRPTSAEAQSIHDAKTQAPVNYATNQRIAERAATYVSDIISQMDISRANIQDKFTVFYALWNGSSMAEYFPTARPLHVPEPFKAVENFVPRAINLLIESPSWFRVVGIDDAGKKNSETITKLILGQLKKCGFYTKMRSSVRDTGIYGYSPAKIYWKKRRRKIRYNKVTDEKSENGEKLTLKRGVETEVNEDGPEIDIVDVFDFMVDHRFHDVQDSPGVVFRSEKFESDIVAMKNSNDYANVSDLLDSVTRTIDKRLQGPPGTAANPMTFREMRDFNDGISMDIGQSKPTYRKYEIYEFWGKFDKDYNPGTGERGEEREYVITLGRQISNQKTADGWVCLRITENPFWHGKRPAVVSHYTRRSHSFHSIGIIEPIVNLSAELDDSRNMALAARALASKPALIADDNADIYPGNMVLEPGTIMRARSTDSVKPLFLPDRSDTAWKAEEVIKNDIREATGIISTYQGTTDSASETATSVATRTREANKRITEVCKNIAEGFLIPMLEMIHSMNQQMITKERLVELVGIEGLTSDIRKIEPAEVAGMVGFEITALPEIEIAGLKARMLEAFTDRAMTAEQMAPGTVRIPELLKMSWEAQFGNMNKGRIFPAADAPLTPRSALDEQYAVGMGFTVDVQENENFLAHFNAHSAFMTTKEFDQWPEDAKRRLMAHTMNTQARLQVEEEKMAPKTSQEVPAQPGLTQPGPSQATPSPNPQPQGGPSQAPRSGVGAINPTSQVRSDAASNAPRSPEGMA